MAEDYIGPPYSKALSEGGIYLAEVVNHLDQTYMGTIEVALFTDLAPNTVYDKSNVIPVRYMSPFSGVTSARFEGNNSGDFNDVQKSYGMWMVPPDVGTTVMVIFPRGAGIGYWIGCVSDMYQNHMIPGIAASSNVAMTVEQERRYGTRYLPVAEYNKKTNKSNNQNISKIPKPIHPFADRLLAQGLILDTIRGVTSSGARREIPSQVFGISTPGPVDTADGAPKGRIGFDGNKQFPISRLGGSTFVMDDGDQNGQNELVRIRTRTGHQILLHNSSDLVYIANSKGTAWIELTSNGKIDIYAEDSVSIHTKGDFNFRADRDFNLEAGRNFNIASNKDININVNENANIISDSVKINVSGEYNLGATGSIKMASNADINSLAGGENKVSASGKVSVTGANVSIGANGKLSLGASRIIAAAGRIDLNSLPGEAPSNADTPTSPTPLNLFSNPQRDPNVSWTTDRYKGADIISIMQRIPSHEPWDQHENIDPNKYSLARTDSAITPTETAANGAVIEGAPSASTPYPAKAGPAVDRGTVRQQKFSWSTDQPFLTKVKEVAGNLGFSPLDLLACMNLESNRSFDPAIDNGLAKDSAGLGYVGLIQFGNDACSSLKVSKSQLVAMSRVQQMDYVEKYFRLNGWPNKGVSTPTIANIYLTILLPVAKFYSADQIIASASDPKTAKYYTPNSGSFDPSPKKGYFTPTMVAAAVQIHLNEVNACLSKAGVGPDLVVPEAPKTGQ
jgi:uncharacterized protein (DUF2345 family)